MGASSEVLLAIDTSTRTIGLALYDGARVLCESTWTSVDYHTVELAPAIDEALRRAVVSPKEIEALAVASGPGSFTGLRIGMALAKGMALLHRRPIIGVPTLDILASAQPLLDIPLVAVLRAGRGRLAVGWYTAEDSAWRSSKEIAVWTPQELADQIRQPVYVCGELTEVERVWISRVCPEVILASAAQSLRRAGYLAELAWKRWKTGKTDDPASLSPIYLHYNEPIPG